MHEVHRRLHEAQAVADRLFDRIEETGLLEPGLMESEASRRVHELAGDEFGGPRWWHKRVVRAGANTVHPYNVNAPECRLENGDVVFVDLGPVFDGWEADVGRSWVLGENAENQRLVDATKACFDRGRQWTFSGPPRTAEQLFAFMQEAVAGYGYEFGNWYCGHLVGEFPHAKFPGEKLESYLAAGNARPIVGEFDDGTPVTWILESHLVDRERGRGAFVEALLLPDPE